MASATNMTPEERTARGRKAAAARWRGLSAEQRRAAMAAPTQAAQQARHAQRHTRAGAMMRKILEGMSDQERRDLLGALTRQT